MFQLPTWPAGNRRATSVAALEAAVNAALGAGGGAEAVLVVPSGADATAEINARLEAMAVAGGGTLRVRRGRIGDPVRLDARVQLRGDDCTLIFDSPIVMGATGSLRIKGDLDEYWRGAVDPVSEVRVENTGDVPSVSVDTSDDPVTGNLVVQFSAASGFVGQFQPGDMVVLRGFLSPTRLAAIEKQFAFVVTVDVPGNRLILDRPRALHTSADDAAEMGKAVGDPFTFRYRYYPPGAPEVPENELTSPTGEGAMATRVKILRTSVLLADKAPGGHRVTVADASGFRAGDLIYLSDDRREVDINPARVFRNLVNMEILTCVAVEDNDLVFEAPTRRQYLSAFGARATRIAPVRRSHIRLGRMTWAGLQPNRNFHAVQVDYGAQCTVAVGMIDGRGGRIAQGIRLSNSHDCHAIGGQIEGAAGSGSGEGYGATLYYSTACSVQGLRISGCRHSILFQGTTFCAAIGNTSTDDLITAIDTHGTNCLGTVIAHNVIRGGVRLTADSTRHTGIRLGNSSHVIPDRETLVFGNRIEGYLGPDDAAMDVVAPSADVLFQANEIIDCSKGLRASSLNSLNTREVMAGLQARYNRFLRCDVGVEFLSAPLMGIRDVTLIANSFTACREPVRAHGFEAGGFLMASGNVAVEPVDPTQPMFDLEGIAAVTITGGNVAPALDLAVQLRDCPDAQVTGNSFGACARAVERLGDTTGAITGDNGVTGSTTGARLERIATDLTMPLAVIAVIPHNNATPSAAYGTSVLATTIATKPGEGLLIEAVLPYVELSGSTGPVTAHLFAGGVALASTTERITTGGSSGSPIRLVGRLVATGTTLTIDLRLGPSTAGPTITVGSKYNGGSDPHLILHRDPA